MPGVTVQRKRVGSVVQGVFLNKNYIWKAVSVDGARLTTLGKHINETMFHFTFHFTFDDIVVEKHMYIPQSESYLLL